MNTKLKYLSIGVFMALHSLPLHAVEFDWNFVRGGVQDDAAWESLTNKFVPGRYLVDVELNGQHLGKRLVTIDLEDTDELCLDKQWFDDAKVYINTDFYASHFNEVRQCYFIERGDSTQIAFDFSTQKLTFSLPQKGLIKRDSEELIWDYGIPALRMNYSANVNVNDIDTTIYGSLGLLGNVGRWVATSSVNMSEDSVDMSTVTASRALYDFKADLTVGRTYTGNSLVGGAGLTGIGVVSNSSMRPNDLGYTPVFSGVASSHARVTLSQNGRSVYSEMVPPGPFEIADVSLLSSGDITMTVTENDGSVTTRLYPLTIMPNMLNPGEIEYGVYSGVRNIDSDELGGLFVAGNVGYGFDVVTLKSSALLHNKYGAIGVGLVSGLGDLGSLGVEGAYSHAQYDDHSLRSGGKVSVTYAKTFSKSTDLQLIGAQYTSINYTEFSQFTPWEIEEQVSNKQKTQYELSLSHQLTDHVSTGLSAWHRIYWGDTEDGTGINARMSARFDYFSLSFGANYNRVGEDDSYSASLSASVPFDVFDTKFSSFSGVTINGNGHESYTTGVSSNISERVNYAASVGWSGSDDKTYSLQTGYHGDRIALNGQLSKTGNRTTGSGSMSGSVIVLPTENDVIFTRNISDTIVIANVADTEGVEFMSSPYPSNARGNAVVPVSAYYENRVTLSGDTLPIDIELLSTEKQVLPTERAVVYMPFESVKVKRYLFQIKEHNGQFVPSGSWAESQTGVPLGFVTQNGILFVNSVDELDGFNIGACVISHSKIKETTQLQEVMCEK
ncbi:PefC/AfrB family outer membrane usher protein [Vibrio scophthalmi]|uniref:Outer membrane usher protein FaeD n=1 Tax=Vibrio scophthalmi TaxID=45658 RepID=A0A1E3WID8_9VIBR|nr:PefC/AfrB family outer membrane usher protein [Vibrio scophthalmi]ODS05579.1 Outer membrane usher protein FaeD [Vibrio scophthalmi]